MEQQRQEKRHALIICDLQNDFVKGIPPTQLQIAYKTINTALECIRSVNSSGGTSNNKKWTIIYTGLKFQKGYQDVSSNHKLYGSMKRLNHKINNMSASSNSNGSNNNSRGDAAVHFFMEGYDGASITNQLHHKFNNGDAHNNDENDESDTNANNEYIIWRNQHLIPKDKLQSILATNQITNVTVCGLKTSTTIQSIVQILCDIDTDTDTDIHTGTSSISNNIQILKEGVVDDNQQRHESICTHLLPIYSNIISLSNFIDDTIGIENMSETCRECLIEVESTMSVGINSDDEPNDTSAHYRTNGSSKKDSSLCHTKQVFRPSSSDTSENTNGNMVEEGKINQQTPYFCTNCERGGHGERYIQFLLQRNSSSSLNHEKWKMYPSQPWYENFQNSYKCPLAKKVVDFCDEPQFSKISMYLLGRDYLDEKDKVITIAGEYMPKTYVWEPSSVQKGYKGGWKDDISPLLDTITNNSTTTVDEAIEPWFIKEADKNLGGPYIGICQHASEIPSFILHDRRYVVQQHVLKPLLTDDGKKTHVKFYILLVCEEDGLTWTLYTYKNAKLSISPNKWSPTDLSQDTQITIHRHPIAPKDTVGWKQHWERTYLKCQEGTADVIQKGIEMGKLKGRKGKKQFEVFSADWMPDEDGNIWLFEFNMSPAVCQKEFDDSDSRDERRDKLMRDDETMLRAALSIAIPLENGKSSVGLWDKVLSFKSDI